MQIPLISALVAIATVTSAAALTGDDIAPAALAGKTFTFTIKAATGKILRSGVWKGTFGEAPTTSFTITNVSGNTRGFSTTYTATALPPPFPTGPFSTTILLPAAFPGSGPATLNLIVAGSISNFTLSSGGGVSGESQTGSFTIGGAATAPEILVKQGVASLIDGSASKIALGTVKIGKSSRAKYFTITNTGDTDLTGLVITKDGKNKADFVVGAPGSKVLSAGAQTKFKVTFKPGSKGTKNAAIHIKSNDVDENPFDIKLTGVGIK